MPDGLLLYDCGIKVLLEIENTGAPTPSYLVGKWATVSLARCFIHSRRRCVRPRAVALLPNRHKGGSRASGNTGRRLVALIDTALRSQSL